MNGRSVVSRKPFRLTHTQGGIALLAAGVVTAGGVICIAQPNNAQQQKGVARVVERSGPEVEVKPNGQGGQVVVLFPQSSGQANAGEGANDVEIVLVESQLPAAQNSGDQQQGGQQQQPNATGRELLFSSRDANEGIVRYTLDTSGNGRRYKVLARVGGEYVQAQQIGGNEGITLFSVKRPDRPQQQQQQQQQQQPQGDQNNANNQANAQPAADQQAQNNQQQQQQQPQQPAPAAIIMLYGGATNQ